jgi:hypothetical protein
MPLKTQLPQLLVQPLALPVLLQLLLPPQPTLPKPQWLAAQVLLMLPKLLLALLPTLLKPLPVPPLVLLPMLPKPQ